MFVMTEIINEWFLQERDGFVEAVLGVLKRLSFQYVSQNCLSICFLRLFCQYLRPKTVS